MCFFFLQAGYVGTMRGVAAHWEQAPHIQIHWHQCFLRVLHWATSDKHPHRTLLDQSLAKPLQNCTHSMPMPWLRRAIHPLVNHMAGQNRGDFRWSHLVAWRPSPIRLEAIAKPCPEFSRATSNSAVAQCRSIRPRSPMWSPTDGGSSSESHQMCTRGVLIPSPR